MDIFDALEATDCTICLEPLADDNVLQPFSEEPADTTDKVVSYAPGLCSSAATSTALSNIVVLPCGHLLHFLCFEQLVESSIAEPGCPVCRSRVSVEQVVRLHLRVRYSPLLNTSLKESPASSHDVASSNGKTNPRKRSRGDENNKIGGTEELSAVLDDIVLVRENHVDPPCAYRDYLRRTASVLQARLESLKNRTAPLTQKHQQLEEDTATLRASLEEARRCAAVLKGPLSQECLKECRELSRRMQFAFRCCTSEVAATLREIDLLNQQIEKYNSKMETMRQHYAKLKILQQQN